MEQFLDYFYFPIFPEGSLAHSIITTVWVGVIVVAFFNLRYGWVLSGLVVPGYITPLLLVKPLAVWVIAAESIVVYLLVYTLSIYGSKYRLWSSFFGRDRFFAILLVSVLVRVLFDGLLLSYIGEWYVSFTGDPFDYRNNFHSFGLIIIALIANMLWKPGLIRGIPPVVIIIAITYLITRYILVEWTNFSLSNLSYLYEDFSSNILASPKSYIILLTAAFIASRMNLRYGWDFNGILIPALLALQWYQPSKIFISFIEAIIIYLLALAVLKLPFFKTLNMEGSRKILLFFNIGFFYKILLSYFIMWTFPEVKVSDLFGFGYLLSTLIAIKMFDKDVIALFIRATLQTSFVSIIVASLIGFSLSLFTNTLSNQRVETFSNGTNVQNINIVNGFDQFILSEKIKLYKNIQPQSFVQPTSSELLIFSDLTKTLLKIKEIDQLYKLQSGFEKLSINLTIADNRYIILSDNKQRGWGIYVVDIKSDNEMLVGVPAPLDELGSFESGLVLFKSMNAKGFSVAGTKRGTNISKSSDVLQNRYTIFYDFFSSFHKNNCVIVRGYNLQNSRKIFQKRFTIEEFDKQNMPNIAFIKGKIPHGINLKLLEQLTKKLDIHWQNSPDENIINETSNNRFMEIYFSKQTRRYMITSLLKTNKLYQTQTFQRIDGYFQEWILSEKDVIAPKGSEKYVPPNIQELLYFDKEILTPLFKFVLKSQQNKKALDDESKEVLNSIASLASVVGYTLIHYHHIASNQDYLILQESNESDKKYRGSYVIRYSRSNSYVVQIARPLFERSTFEYGVSLFERSKALALQIGGAHPYANSDRSSDLLKFSNKQSFYNLFNQVLLRETKDLALLSVSLRAFGNRTYTSMPKEDVVMSFYENSGSKDQLNNLSKELYEVIKQDGLDITLTDGSLSTSGYEVNSIVQSLYIPQTQNKDFALIWLSPKIRDMYKQKEKDSYLVRSMEHLGIKSKDIYIEKWIQSISFNQIDNDIYNKIVEYSKSKDPIVIVDLISKGIKFEVLYDLTNKMTFLAVIQEKKVAAIIKLHSSSLSEQYIYKINENRDHILLWVYSKNNILKVVK